MNGWMVLLWSFVATVILVVAGVFGVLVVMDRISLFPSVEATSSSTPDSGVVDTSYSVLILNASGAEELQTSVTDAVVGAGWVRENVDGTTSATTFDTTTIYYAAEEDAEAALGLAGVIGGALTEINTTYGTAEDHRLTVVIGTDKAEELGDSGDGAAAE